MPNEMTELIRPPAGTETRLMRIVHMRCGDYSANTFILVPATWTKDQVKTVVTNAQMAYLDALRNLGKNPPNDYKPYSGPPYKAYPNKTVLEVDAIWEAKRREWEVWKKENDKASKRFSDFLIEEGVVSLYDASVEEFELDWGHNHALPIRYDDTATDTLPTPRGLIGDEDEFPL